MSQETINSYYRNCGVHHFGDDGRGGYRYQDTSHSYSCNHGAGVDVDRRGGYRSQTNHSSSHNPGGHGRLLSLPASSCTVDDNVDKDERLRYSGQGDERGDTSDTT